MQKMCVGEGRGRAALLFMRGRGEKSSAPQLNSNAAQTQQHPRAAAAAAERAATAAAIDEPAATRHQLDAPAAIAMQAALANGA